MPITPDDQVLVTINSTYFGQRIMSTFGYAAVIVTAAHEPDEAVDALLDVFKTGVSVGGKYYDCCSADVQGTSLWGQLIRPLRLRRRTHAAVGDGALTPDQDPVSNVAAVIGRFGNEANRRNMSTLHVPLAADLTIVEGGIIKAGQKVLLQALADEMKDSISTFAGNIVWAPAIINTDPLIGWTRVVDTQVQDTSRVMRRRTVGVGI